jgi:hypothetical protein
MESGTRVRVHSVGYGYNPVRPNQRFYGCP